MPQLQIEKFDTSPWFMKPATIPKTHQENRISNRVEISRRIWSDCWPL